MSSLPKATCYYSETSVFSAAVRLTLLEKGYGSDEVDLKLVDLAKGENFSPAFLRLNAKGTVPTLVVPLEKTLSEDVETRFKALTETKAILEFLDKSRSPMSFTHTTSTAPAPTLTPATIAFTTLSNAIIEQLAQSDPNRLLLYSALDDPGLRQLSESLLPYLAGRAQALSNYLSQAESNVIQVTERVKTFWKTKRDDNRVLLDVFSSADKSLGDLDPENRRKRQEYFATASTGWQVTLKSLLQSLSDQIISPYVLGDHLSLTDIHLAAWLSRIFRVVGVDTTTDDGTAAIRKVQAKVGGDIVRLEKLQVFWDTIRERESFKQVYSNGLF